MIKRRICVITGSRAEYGLLYWLIKEISNDKNLKLQLLVTGTHLYSYYGSSIKKIDSDFKINQKIDIKLSSNNAQGILNSMSVAQISFGKAYKKLKPDIIVVLGDRYEILSAAIAAMISNIPIAHIHGGEKTEGAMDESIRHSITKMSHLHFTSTLEYKKRLIQLGEQPNRVFYTGGMGVEWIKRTNFLSKRELEKSIKFKFNKKNLLVTFHPVTLENNSKSQFKELLNAIDELDDTNIIFTRANSDIDGKFINQMIDEYTKKNFYKSIVIKSMGQIIYLSSLKYVDAVVGNSSSGLLEAPSFKVATIDIGDRQRGRISCDSVIKCRPLKKEILKSIQKIYTKDFQKLLKNVKNPYEKSFPSKKIVSVLKNFKTQNILKKVFYDLK